MRSVMTMEEYQRAAQHNSPDDGHDKVDNGILGLIGETGELVDVYKKWKYQSPLNARIPTERFADELGDVLWYLAELAAGMGKTLIQISGEDFAGLDRCACAASRQKTIRSLVIGISGVVGRLARHMQISNNKRAEGEMRLILIASARLARAVGYDIQSVARDNIVKIRRRYPNGFDPGISEARYASEEKPD